MPCAIVWVSWVSSAPVGFFTQRNRNPVTTKAALPLLGIEDQISYLVCRDDHIPTKPIYQLDRQLGVIPESIMMVGDILSDLVMATRAALAVASVS